MLCRYWIAALAHGDVDGGGAAGVDRVFVVNQIPCGIAVRNHDAAGKHETAVVRDSQAVHVFCRRLWDYRNDFGPTCLPLCIPGSNT